MKLERLTAEIERVLEQSADDLEEYLEEWLEWDDEHGKDKEEDLSEPIPEGLCLTITLGVNDSVVEEEQVTFSITGAVTLHAREEE